MTISGYLLVVFVPEYLSDVSRFFETASIWLVVTGESWEQLLLLPGPASLSSRTAAE